MSNDMFHISFRGIDEAIKASEKKAQLLNTNIQNAIARTVLWGATMIAEDCPVDTGRLKSSILGYLAEEYGIPVDGSNLSAIEAGKEQSTTSIGNHEGRIGTNVKYAMDVEYAHFATGRKKMSSKEKQFLYSLGMIKKVSGRGFFRKNLALIDQYFQTQMDEAIQATSENRVMPVTY